MGVVLKIDIWPKGFSHLIHAPKYVLLIVLHGLINGEVRVGIREASVKIAISHTIFQSSKASLIAQYFFLLLV